MAAGHLRGKKMDPGMQEMLNRAEEAEEIAAEIIIQRQHVST